MLFFPIIFFFVRIEMGPRSPKHAAHNRDVIKTTESTLHLCLQPNTGKQTIRGVSGDAAAAVLALVRITFCSPSSVRYTLVICSGITDLTSVLAIRWEYKSQLKKKSRTVTGSVFCLAKPNVEINNASAMVQNEMLFSHLNILQ